MMSYTFTFFQHAVPNIQKGHGIPLRLDPFKNFPRVLTGITEVPVASDFIVNLFVDSHCSS